MFVDSISVFRSSVLRSSVLRSSVFRSSVLRSSVFIIFSLNILFSKVFDLSHLIIHTLSSLTELSITIICRSEREISKLLDVNFIPSTQRRGIILCVLSISVNSIFSRFSLYAMQISAPLSLCCSKCVLNNIFFPQRYNLQTGDIIEVISSLVISL